MSAKHMCSVLLLILLVSVAGTAAADENKISVSTGVDLFNRYVWRGLDIANTPSIQPTLAVEYAGFELGTWGAYTLSNDASDSDEIDFWLSYTANLNNGVSVTAMVTDYYLPNAGIDFFNFNDYDAMKDDTIPDPGAHLLEVGVSVTGPESFPVTVSGYVNVYNEEGNNAYFQLDYPVAVDGTELNFSFGATTGSEDNPGYYGANDFGVINLGLTASRDVKMSESFSLPLTVSLIVNPDAEISHMLVGVSF